MWKPMRDILLYFSSKYLGDWNKIYNALDTKEEINLNKLNALKDKEFNAMTILDNDYPTSLKLIKKPPFVLYYKGNKKLLNQTNVIWEYGSYINVWTKKTIDDVKNLLDKIHVTVVTGQTDVFEHHLVNNTKKCNIILVKDSGIDSCLITSKKMESKIIKDQGLIISEHPSYVIPSLKTWENSNRIKIGLSKSLFLINSLKDETAFKIIRDSLEENKEVYAWNKTKDNKTHNSILIKNGAYAINDIEELKE